MRRGMIATVDFQRLPGHPPCHQPTADVVALQQRRHDQARDLQAVTVDRGVTIKPHELPSPSAPHPHQVCQQHRSVDGSRGGDVEQQDVAQLGQAAASVAQGGGRAVDWVQQQGGNAIRRHRSHGVTCCLSTFAHELLRSAGLLAGISAAVWIAGLPEQRVDGGVEAGGQGGKGGVAGCPNGDGVVRAVGGGGVGAALGQHALRRHTHTSTHTHTRAEAYD